MKLNARLGIILIAVGLVAGCNYSVDKVGRPSGGGQKPGNSSGNGESGGAPTPVPDAGAPKFSEIHPVLIAQCLGCHSNSRRVASLSVETWETMIENPRAIVAGDADNSGIYASVTDDYMPDAGWVARGLVRPLTPQEKEALRRWINAGALKN